MIWAVIGLVAVFIIIAAVTALAVVGFYVARDSLP